MIDPNKKDPIPVSASDVCYRAFELIAAKQYADAEKLLAGTMSRTDDDAAVALYHSVMGVLFKVQGEFKTAWKHYERAEKLLPRDPALKIISARLLIEQFAEYDQAVRKAKKVLDLIPGNPVFAHQAYTTMGLAYLKKGDRRKAADMLGRSMGDGFKGFVSAKNIDLALVEGLMRRGAALEVCRRFLSEANEFAVASGEEEFVSLFSRLMEAFDRENPALAGDAAGHAEPEEITEGTR
ncbi:MAG: hypothetical protein JXA24_06660 [Proteobacteria bacterium]|nr:hypothetical protein [Pseudomonadota bacterium]